MFKNIKPFTGIYLLLALALTLGGVVYDRFPVENRTLLSGAAFGDINDVAAIEFNAPTAYAVPINNVVTISSVYVDYTVATDGVVAGSDLIASPITFTPAVALPAGASIIDNKIYLPSTFTAFDIQISLQGAVVSNDNLTITPGSCVNIESHLIRAYGNGLDFPASGDDVLPEPSTSNTTTDPFDFNDVAAITSVVIKYPVAYPNGPEDTGVQDAPYGAKTFHITVNMVSGLEERAKITYNNGNGVYEISVRDEGQTPATASNFAFVFDDLLGLNSPFSASVDADSVVNLLTRELGDHTLGYECLVNDAVFPSCFQGGEDGTNDLLTTPLFLDNIMTQGSTSLVYAGNSIGITEWTSSNASILEVSTLTEAEQQGASTVSFVSQLLADSAVYDAVNGSYVLSNCTESDLDDSGSIDQGNERTCDIDVTIPVEYDISGNNYTANVAIGTEVVDVTVQGSKLVGSLTGSGTWIGGVGVSMQMTGTVTGTVSGTASGNATGNVFGTVSADINANPNVSETGLVTIALAKSDFDAELNVPADINAGFLAETPAGFTSNVKLTNSSEVTNFALLYAKRPGTAVLTIKDELGCIAAMDVVVSAQVVTLKMIGQDPSNTFDVGDSITVNAFLGSEEGEEEEKKNITGSSAIEWVSSNPAVAEVDDTGLVTVLSPGKTNITARYDTGIAEVGTIESAPLLINVGKIKGLTIALDENSQSLLPTDFLQNGKKAVTLVLNSPAAVGNTLSVEGQTVTVTLPAGTYVNNLARVTAIAGQLVTDLTALQNSQAQAILRVTASTEFPGVIVLEPLNQGSDTDGDNVEDLDENGRVDITTSAHTEDLTLLPHYGNTVNLPAAVNYSMLVIAEYDDGKTKRLPPSKVKWVNTPLNYLNQSSLDTGVLKLGEISGTSTVVAEFTNGDSSVINSNSLVVVVDSGPAIDYVRRIGFGSILKGGRIHLQAKVTDVDTVADIQDIQVSLVKSAYSTYNQILADTGAAWFTATPFVEEVAVEDENTEGTDAEPALQYRIYDIPVEIPLDGGLFDGNYRLVLSIFDKASHTVNYVLPIYIGKAASGDVNGDNFLSLIDVVLAFQMVTGSFANPTSAQLAAANMDGQGSVTMIDVILLFRKVASG